MFVFLCACSMFLSALLLFTVEPMIAKMLLPTLGGSSAVWTSCLMFYQAALLIGYLYAHASMNWLGRKAQIVAHSIIVGLPLLLVGTLPIHVKFLGSPRQATSPILWLLGALTATVALPFSILASNTPIMQRWFSESGKKQAKDPYFLYSASNAGSLMGLLAYPLLIEPRLSLLHQSAAWGWGYRLFAVVSTVCASIALRRAGAAVSVTEQHDVAPAPSTEQRFRWLAFAFVPSSLVLGVTTTLTTDVPAIPLFWVLPLGTYLLTFILAFARKQVIPHDWLVRGLPIVSLLAIFPLVSRLKLPFLILLALYLISLFWVSTYCHRELALSRPGVTRLTEYYLLISAGGVLGGIFNSILAPVIFSSVVEFPLVLVLANLLRAWTRPGTKRELPAYVPKLRDLVQPILLGMSILLGIAIMIKLKLRPDPLPVVLFFAYAMLWCFSFRKSPYKFVLGISAILLAGSFYTGPLGTVLDTERSFFGVSRVTIEPTARFRYLVHGGTLHGVQSLDSSNSKEPLSYYTKSGPAGSIFRALERARPRASVAVIGLGAGALACRISPVQAITYYEIDPLVIRIAENTRYFTFLSECAPNAKIVLGDARLRLNDAADAQYDLIVVDAFSGDSIPMHLISREALTLYRKKLAPGGMIAFHISNIFLDLEPTLANLAADAHMACLVANNRRVTDDQLAAGTSPSIWVVVASQQTDLVNLQSELMSTAQWVPARRRPGSRVWTDDYSNLLEDMSVGWN